MVSLKLNYIAKYITSIITVSTEVYDLKILFISASDNVNHKQNIPLGILSLATIGLSTVI